MQQVNVTKNPLIYLVPGLFLAFFILQVVFLLIFPVSFSIDITYVYGFNEPGIAKILYYWLFQYLSMSTYPSYYMPIFLLEEIIANSVNYISIPLSLFSTIYIANQRKTPSQMLDKDHTRHVMLIGYILLLALVSSMLDHGVIMIEATALQMSSSAIIAFFLLFIVPNLILLILSFLIVAATHARNSQLNHLAP